MADQISEVSVSLCTQSKFVTPFRLHYKQDGVQKAWDYIKGHDSIAVLLYNKDRDVFPVVKQFRPAVYAAKVNAFTDGATVDTTQHKGEMGMTLELCAGLMDKDKDVVAMAQDEILEETGYKVPKENIKKVTSFRCGIGTEGSQQTMFYAEVSDQMKFNSGGGLAEEGEMIEVVELSRQDAMKFIMAENVTRTSGIINGVGVKGTLMTLFYAEVTDSMKVGTGGGLVEEGEYIELVDLPAKDALKLDVGVRGTLLTLFYAEVNDSMKVSAGGGVVDEGEYIEVIDLPAKDAMKFVMDESITKPVPMMFALQWFFFMKDKDSVS